LPTEEHHRCTLHSPCDRFSSDGPFVRARAKLGRRDKLERDVHGQNIGTIAEADLGIDDRSIAHALNTLKLERQRGGLCAIDALKSIVGVRASARHESE
jgi:hypothetical protein